MRLELLQVADMVDPRFGYRKEALEGRRPHENLVRDRYHVMWQAYTLGRLARAGHADPKAIDALQAQLQRVFSTSNGRASAVSVILDRLVRARELTHKRFLAWANSPSDLLDEQGLASAGGNTMMGQACPVCDCSTFFWTDRDCVTRQLVTSVQKDFPSWQPDQGIGRQCTEVYTSSAGTKLEECGGSNRVSASTSPGAP
jgi:hypothetical protein